MRALSSQTCFSTIALAHQRNKKHPWYRSASELHKNTVPCKNKRNDSTFTSTKVETWSGMKTFAPNFEALFQSSFTFPSFF